MNFPFHRPAALCGLALLALTPIARAAEAVAQEPTLVALADLPAQPIVVTATRIAQPVSETLADVRVIDSQQLRNAGPATLTEVLQLYGGAEIVRNGGAGQTSNVFLRGTNSSHVVVLVDGVRVSSATTGTSAFEQLPLNQIERIEVLRGPASSLYGADAIGGVIQIFTKQGERSDARVALGSDRTRDVSVGLGRSFGDTSLSLQAGHRRTEGFSAKYGATGVNADNDGARNANVGMTLTHNWAKDQRLTVRGFVSRSTSYFDDEDFLGTEIAGKNRQRVSSLSVESQNALSATWRSLLRAARSEDRSTSTGAYPGTFNTRQDQLTWQNDVSALGGNLAAGLEWRRESVDSSLAFEQTERTIRSAFASYATHVGLHLLEASLRHDDNSQFGGHTTGRLGYGYQLTPAWRLSAAAGTAFKAPTFNDLYYPNYGDPLLRPERSNSVELAARFANQGVDAGATLFRNRIRDLITSSSTTVFNQRARIDGLTLDAGYVGALWQARAEWTHQEPEADGTGEQLLRRARNHATLSLSHTPGLWRLGAEVVASSARYDYGYPTNPRMGGYAYVNLRAGYQLTPEWSASARLNNVADKNYELAYGYNTPGRQFFVALEYAGK